MITRSMLGLGLVSSLICGTAATADLLGLDYRIAGTNSLVEGTPDDNWTVEIYAVLPEGERLDAVAGNKANNKTVATSGTFYQNVMGGPTSTSINSAFFPLAPDLEFDSYVTVGALHSNGYPFDNNALLDIGIDWTDFEAGGDVSTANGTWFVTPADPQGQATLFTNQACEDHYGVLVARLTVIGPDSFDQNVYFNGLFQGKDALDNTWQGVDEITIWYPTISDCNSNGVDDDCDIANGDSLDDNGNGIPDECEFTDCNDNDVADEDDIANGTSDDCNFNGIPDECELVGGDCNDNGILDECEAFDDCNDNDIPDECETFNDCNGNSVPDECEELHDWDGNNVPDACEGLVAYNTTSDNGYGDLESAINDSNDGDIVWVDDEYAETLIHVDFHGRAIQLDVIQAGLMEAGFNASVQMADGATLNVGNDTGSMSALRSGTSGTAQVNSGGILTAYDVIAYRDSTLDLTASDSISIGPLQLRKDSELSLNAPASTVWGVMYCSEGSTIYATTEFKTESLTEGTFDLFGSMTNAGDLWATDDILISSNFTNDQTVRIFRGVFYVLGGLFNNGEIYGEVDDGPGVRGGEANGPAPGDGMRVIGDYVVGENASLHLQHGNWQLAVGGNLDIAINDSNDFDMSLATLKLNGIDTQTVEVMGADYGGIEEALNPAYGCTFPIGNVKVASGSHVVLVDNRENDCEGDLAEVMYTRNLIVAPGATLDTNGLVIYVSEVDNQGIIIGEDDIIIINPPVLGDLNGDSVVNIDDLLVVIGADWGACAGCDADANGDGFVNIDDMLLVISNWTL